MREKCKRNCERIMRNAEEERGKEDAGSERTSAGETWKKAGWKRKKIGNVVGRGGIVRKREAMVKDNGNESRTMK